MSSKRQLTCPLPDGTVATRTTARTYSHVFAIHNAEGWGALAWAGRLDLAINRLSRFECLVQRDPEARLAIIEIETGKVVWEHEGHIRVAKPEPVAPVAQPAPVPSAPREPKPSKQFKDATDICSFVAIALQPAIVDHWGRRGTIHRIAEALLKDGVTERRIHNAIRDDLLAVEILTAMSMITIDS